MQNTQQTIGTLNDLQKADIESLPVLTLSTRAEKMQWVKTVLNQFAYFTLSREDKGLVRAYIQHMTGCSRAQTARYIADTQSAAHEVSAAPARKIQSSHIASAVLTLALLLLISRSTSPMFASVLHTENSASSVAKKPAYVAALSQASSKSSQRSYSNASSVRPADRTAAEQLFVLQTFVADRKASRLARLVTHTAASAQSSSVLIIRPDRGIETKVFPPYPPLSGTHPAASVSLSLKDVLVMLGSGTDGQILQMQGGRPAWVDFPYLQQIRSLAPQGEEPTRRGGGLRNGGAPQSTTSTTIVNNITTGGTSAPSGWTEGVGVVYLTDATDFVGIGTDTPDTNLEVVGSISGASLYIASSIEGAGLTACDPINGKIVWDSVTKQFSCGTDNAVGTGLSIQTADQRYVKKQGDTMTGALVISIQNGNLASVGLNVINTISGAIIHAEKSLTTSGTLVFEGAASGSSLYLGKSLNGAGLVDCSTAGTSKLLWNATSGRFSCGTDTDTNTTYTAGQGLGMNGTIITLNANLSGSLLRFTTVSGSTVFANTSLRSSGSLTVAGNTILRGTISGSTLHIEKTLSVSGSIVTEGTISGANLFVGTSITGAGLTTCSNATTSKLLWNSATGRFSCGSDQNTTAWSSTGALQIQFDNRYVRTSGGTMTGALNVTRSISGATIHAEKSLTTSGTLVFEGAASGSSLYLGTSLNGAGLVDCSTAGTSKLLWNATTGRFGCGTDQNTGTAYTAGQGIGVNSNVITLNASISGSLIRFTTVSGSTLYGKNSINSSGSITAEGTISGANLFVGTSITGAGLTACNSATSALQWNAVTGRFSCGTIAAGSSTSSGNVITIGDSRYVRKSGDTMTGALTVAVTNGNRNTLGINVANTISGAVIHAEKSLTTSGTLVFEGAASGSSLYLGTSLNGAGLVDCSTAGTSKLLWNSVSGRFSCGTDTDTNTTYTAGQGLSLNGTVITLNANISGSLIRFTTISGSTVFAKNTLATSGSLIISGTANVRGAFSGSNIHAEKGISASGSITTEGTISGANLFIGTGITGAGLTTCSNATTSKLLWNAATGRFSCGSDQNTTAWSSTGALQIQFDNRYVRTSGGTMTGALNVTRSISGATIHAEKSLTTSGTLVFEGAASGSSLYIASSLQGAGLVDCSTSGTSKLLWNAASGRFSCGTDQNSGTTYTAGQGLSLNGTVITLNANISGSLIRFTTVSGSTVFAKNTLRSSGSLIVDGTAAVRGAFSGSNIHAEKGISASGSITTEGTISGASLYIGTSINGAGLSDCVGGNKLLWNGTTGRFSCGVDQAAGTGLDQNSADARYVNTSGDTMTGALTVAVTNGNRNTVGINVVNTLSGAVIHAEKSLTTSGTLVFEGAASGSSLYLATSLQGAGLVDCSTAGTSKLLWNAASGRFSCGTDTDTNTTYTAGQGLSINGTVITLNANISGSLIRFNTVSGSTVFAKDLLAASGSLSVEGTSLFEGTTILGDSSADSILFVGSVASNITPAAANVSNLGSASNYWAQIFANTISTKGTVSGAILHADKSLTTSGTLVFEGAASGSSLYLGTSLNGAGLVDCSTAGTSKLLWNAVSGRFSCGTDTDTNTTYTAGQGLSLNGTVITLNANISGSLIRFTTISGSTVFAKNTLATSGSLIVSGAANIRGSFSGSNIHAEKGISASGSITTEGTISGANLYVGTAVRGAGLVSDCNTSTSALQWSSSTGRFSCGTISAGSSTSSGNVITIGDSRYVKKSGDTMTGALTIRPTAGSTTVGLNVAATMSGRSLQVTGTGSSPLLYTDVKNGRVGINTNAPQYTLDVMGSGSASLRLGRLGTQTGMILTRSNNNTLTLTNRVLQPASNYALNLNGSTQYATVGDMATNPSNFTVELWAKRGTVTQSFQAFVGLTSSYVDTGWVYENGTVAFGNAAGTWGQWNSVWTDKTSWHHLAFVVTGGNSVTFYFDGVAQGAAQTMSSTSSWNNVYIGATSANTSITFPGSIDEFRLYSAALSSGTISSHYNGGTGNYGLPGETNLIAGWHFDDASGTTAADYSGGGKTATLTGGAGWAIGFVQNPVLPINTTIFTSLDGASPSELGILKIGDTNGGTWLQGQTLKFLLGGTERARFSTGGLLGLGTTTPGSTLSVSGATIIGKNIGGRSAKTGLGLEVIGGMSGSFLSVSRNLNVTGAILSVGNITTRGMMSGSVLFANQSVRSSGSIVAEGTISGANLFVGTGITGAGLTTCSNATTSKLLWNSATGRFSCGTDFGTNFGSGQVIAIGDTRYIRTSGGTMTGALTVAVTNGNRNTLGINVANTISGAVIHAEKSLTTSGTLVFEGAASGSSLYLGTSLNGAGLVDCSTAGTSKLLWNAASGRFSCGSDQNTTYTAGQGLSLNGTVITLNANISGSLIRFTTVSGSTVFAKNTLRSSGSLIVDGAATVRGSFSGSNIHAEKGISASGSITTEGTISGANLFVGTSITGAGLTTCSNGSTSKLLWDSATGRFSCGTDQTGGAGFGSGQVIVIGDTRFVRKSGDTMTGSLIIRSTSGSLGIGLNVVGTMSGVGLHISGTGSYPLMRTFPRTGTVIIGSGSIRGGSGYMLPQLYVPGGRTPVLVGNVSTTAAVDHMAVQGNTIVATAGTVLRSFDISTPTNPKFLSTAAVTSSNPASIVIQGKYAFIGVQIRIQSFDISNPAAIVPLNVFTPTSAVNALAVQGRYLYSLNTTSARFQVIDISNPSNMVGMATVVTGTTPNALAVQGRYAYITNGGSNTLQVIDLKNATAPVSLGTVSAGTTPNGVAVQGRFAYVINSAGLQIFDVSNPSSVASVSTLASGAASDIKVSGRYAYIVGTNGFQTIDISDPRAPYMVSTVSPGLVTLNQISLQGRYAYVSYTGGTRLYVYDLGGAEIQNAEIGVLDAGAVNIRELLQGMDASFQGSVSAGASLIVAGHASFGTGGMVTIGTGGLVVRGPGFSGSSVYAATSIQGAGLADCSTAATSKLLWTAATGRFSCGTDTAGSFSTGNVLTIGNARYVELKGDSMTGSLQTPSINLSGVLLTSLNGFNEALNLNNAGLATYGVTRLQSNGNLINIGSIQSGEINATMGGTFATKADYAATFPFGIAMGDVNGDGKQDLVAANEGTTNISVFINTGTGTYRAKVDYTTGSAPYAVAIADFNGDGRADIVSANNSNNNISVLMNTGNGLFATKVDYTAGTNPRGVTTGDFNGDGKPDIAATNVGDSTVSIFFNNGNGTFGSQTTYATGANPYGVAVGDLNGDGRLDMVTGNASTSVVSTFLNRGNGLFATKVDYTVGTGPYSVAIGDVNGDGKADIAAGNYFSDTVSILRNNGDGTFATKVDYTTGGTPRSVAIGDLNGDGKADLAIANYNSGAGTTVSILSNKGNGTFNAKADYTVGTGPSGVVIGDLSGDGIADLGVANDGSAFISILLNNPKTLLYASAGTGGAVGIGTSTPGSKLAVSGSVLIGNNIANRAAKAQLEVIGTVSGTTIFANQSLRSSGSIVAEGAISGASLYIGTSIKGAGLVTDCNTAGSSALQWTASTGRFSCGTISAGGTFSTGNVLTIGSAKYVSKQGDTMTGALTIQVSTATRSGALVVVNTTRYGTGAYITASGTVLALDSTSGSPSTSRHILFGYKGNFDTALWRSAANVLSTNGTFSGATVYAAKSLRSSGSIVAEGAISGASLYIGTSIKGAGLVTDCNASTSALQWTASTGRFSCGTISAGSTFSTGNVLTIGNQKYVSKQGDTMTGTLKLRGLVFASGATLVESSGFNEFVNLIHSGLGTKSITRLTANGDLVNINTIQANQTTLRMGGTFLPKVDYAMSVQPYHVATTDVDGDGKMDIVTSNSNVDSISVFRNTGTGAFRNIGSYTTGDYPTALAIGDMNGDGKPDVAVANYLASTMSVLLSNGSGTFMPKTDYTAGAQSISTAIGDMNGDGRLDLLTVDANDYTISIFLNTGNGLFAPRVTYATNTAPEAASIADFNGDGKQDIVVTHTTSNVISIFLNKGDGTFLSKVDYAKGNGAYGYPLAVADFNGDGKADIAAPNSDDHTIGIFRNNGNGTFATRVDYAAGNAPYQIIAADINGDGRPDLATANVIDNTVSVFMNNGNGTFATQVTYATGSVPESLAFGDFNNDGLPDIVTGNISSNTLSVLLNDAKPILFAGAGSGGYVSIGTAVTKAKLTVTSTISRGTGAYLFSSGGTVLALEASTQSGARTPNIAFGYRGNFDTRITRTATGSLTFASNTGVLLTLDTERADATGNVFQILSDATTSYGGPDENKVFRIQANGATFADGAYTSNGADYAEWFYSGNEKLTPGEVVCIDITKNNSVKRCINAADANIMGIVSTNPAFIGNGITGADGLIPPGYALIGLIGQVPAHVIVEGTGAIRPGDALTSAKKPGYARKAMPGESTVGVALEGISSGEGVVNVLISRRNSSMTVDAVGQKVLDTIASMKIGDEVQLMVASSLQNLNVDDQIQTEVRNQVSNLKSYDADIHSLQAEIDDLKNQLAVIKSQTGSTTTVVTTGSGSGSALAADLTAATLVLEQTLTTGDDARIGGDLHIDGSLMASSLFVPNGLTIDGGTTVAGTLAATTITASSGATIDGTLTVNGNIRIHSGALLFDSGSTVQMSDLIVEKSLRIVGSITIDGLARFFGNVEVYGELRVSGRQAGVVTVPAGSKSVSVQFSTGFSAVPIITATPNDFVFSAWRVKPVTQTGFTIEFATVQDTDVTFSWHALIGLDQGSTGIVQENTSTIFPMGSDNIPVSSDMFWNACIRNTTLLDADGKPHSCARYHEDFTWHQPDLLIDFLWNTNMTPPLLIVPDGYTIEVTESADSIRNAFSIGDNEEAPQSSSEASSVQSSEQTSSAASVEQTSSAMSSEASSAASQESSETSVASSTAISSEASIDELTINPVTPESEVPTTPQPEPAPVTE